MAASGEPIGAYRLVTRLGAGGMGEVWLAEHALLGRRAALKLLHPGYSSQPEIVTRFFNEARAATSIADAGIVQIFDFGYHEGHAFIVMELLDGETLDARCRRLGVLPLGDALRIVRQVASSLGAAHARGIVHRDLKPENIFLVRDPEVAHGERAKILDFGIAKLGGDAGIKTQTSAVMGTPHFMSPEQCRGAGQVDARADVYSLGCVLFALLAGTPPFDAEGIGDLIAMHLREPPPRLSSRAPGIPPGLDDLVARCLDKAPQARFASGTDLAAAIEVLLTGAGAPSHTTPTTLSGSAAQTDGRERRRSTRALVGIGIAAACVAGAGLAVALSGRSAPARIAATAAAPSASAAVAPPPPPPAAQPPSVIAPPLVSPPPIEPAIASVLTAFSDWAKRHPNARCPRATDLGATTDPWGHAFQISCTAQPPDQIIGVISAGSDGVLGTSDDIDSWKLGTSLADLARGPRWSPGAPRRRAAPPVQSPAPSAPPPQSASPPPAPSDQTFDDQLNQERQRAKQPVIVEPVK